MSNAGDKNYNKQHMKQVTGKVFDVTDPSNVVYFSNTVSTHTHEHFHPFGSGLNLITPFPEGATYMRASLQPPHQPRYLCMFT